MGHHTYKTGKFMRKYILT